jgi:uncharacterized protein YjbI with pentapeptide repeats
MKPDPETLLQRYAQGERDFSRISLNECSLSGVKLPHIILQEASLKIVNLSTANLSHSNLQRAILNVSRLSGANLSQANLQQAQLNVANLIRAVLVGANLTKASLIRAELLRADLSNAILSGANFQEADLREARLRWANLSGANLSRCNLRNSSLLGANLSAAQLYSAVLDGATLGGASLMGAELRHANLRSADLSGANLRGANLRWANLSGANLREADLTDAKLSGADLMGAQLEGATLENTTLVHADLSRSNWHQARCVGSDLSGATLTGAQMQGATCYDIQTLEMLCEWVDLSPLGDGSQRRYFNNAVDIHTFLNQRPPQVQLVVDVPLNPTAHVTLAKIYEQLGQQVSLFSRPPNIEVTNRRTILTFIAEGETGLSAIAYLATWPFRDGEPIQNTLITLITEGLERPDRSCAQDESHRHLHTVITTLRQQELKDLKPLLADQPFFEAPLQVKLINTAGHSLELFHNPRFGIRNLPPSDSIFPLQPAYLPAPQVEDYLAFLSPAGD